MKKSYNYDVKNELENGRQKKIVKGNHKVDKHKKRVYNMATSLKPDDIAFDEYLDEADVEVKRFKFR